MRTPSAFGKAPKCMLDLIRVGNHSVVFQEPSGPPHICPTLTMIGRSVVSLAALSSMRSPTHLDSRGKC